MPAANFSFPTAVDFGAGSIARLPDYVRHYGGRALVVTDAGLAKLPVFAQLLAVLDEAEVAYGVTTAFSPNPLSVECEAGGVELAASGATVVVGFGGGSAIDAAKGMALMATHAPPMLQYDDALGGYDLIRDDLLPVIAVPTTAGTGSEVGRSTVVVDPVAHRKVVVFSPLLMPRVALIDPELMVGMPSWLTAATGFDALTHNLEALVSKGFHPLADGIALEGIALVDANLATAGREPGDLEARGAMAMAALMGATAFQKGLGAAHSLAHPLGTLAGVHHGLANAIVLPYVVAFNHDAVGDAFHIIERRLDLPGTLLERLIGLRAELGIPHTLTAAGVDRGLLEALSDQAFEDVCHGLNPRPCTRDDLRDLYIAAFDGDLPS